MNLKTFYTQKIKFFQKQLSKQKKENRITAYLRALIFISAAFALYYLSFDYRLIIINAILFLGLFLFFVKQSLSIKKKIKLTEAYIDINVKEKTALTGDYSDFHSGEEFIDYNHYYSYDLDIFGEGSLFQYLNRTATISGKKKLAEQLKTGETGKELITKKQKANKELTNNLDWRQKFSATAAANDSDYSENKDSKEDFTLKSLIKWAESSVEFINKPVWKSLLYILPGFMFIIILLYLFNLVPSAFIVLSGLLNLSVIGYHLKTVNREHSLLEKKKQLLNTIKNLLEIIEQKDFESSYLKKLKNKLVFKKTSSVQQITKLSKTLQAFDTRLNIIVGIVLNAVVLWDLQILFRLEKMKRELQGSIPVWFDVVAEFDSMISFSNFSYNNPEFVYPEISEKDFFFDLKEGGHPLIFQTNRVNNSFKIDGLNKMTIITGANMAGKSTFLRTVGINMILGAAGTTVCAKEFSFSPIQIYTSVRTNDSLHKNESYFYAELMRLKKITDYLKSGKKLFIILDEMLKGTNSKDKHTGSRGLIEQLITLKASGLAATHDVQLGKLADEYTNNVNNKRFEVEIANNELVFDYKLKDGISQNLNASFLMKKYGIIE